MSAVGLRMSVCGLFLLPVSFTYFRQVYREVVKMLREEGEL